MDIAVSFLDVAVGGVEDGIVGTDDIAVVGVD